jgi:6-pyruvoyl-tetrahydropterin synthase
MVVDFFDLEKLVAEHILSSVDHRHLNELLANPTAEELVRFFWRNLSPHLSGLEELTLFETPQCSAIYRGEDG